MNRRFWGEASLGKQVWQNQYSAQLMASEMIGDDIDCIWKNYGCHDNIYAMILLTLKHSNQSNI